MRTDAESSRRAAECGLIRELAAEGLDVDEIAERSGIEVKRVRGYVVTYRIPVSRYDAWSRAESRALDRQIQGERRPRTSEYDPELTRACRAIMAYPLKSRTRFLDVDRSVPGGTWQA